MRPEITKTGYYIQINIYIYNFRDYAKLVNYLPKGNYANLVLRKYNYNAENKHMKKSKEHSGLSFPVSIRYISLTKRSETWMTRNRS